MSPRPTRQSQPGKASNGTQGWAFLSLVSVHCCSFLSLCSPASSSQSRRAAANKGQPGRLPASAALCQCACITFWACTASLQSAKNLQGMVQPLRRYLHIRTSTAHAQNQGALHSHRKNCCRLHLPPDCTMDHAPESLLWRHRSVLLMTQTATNEAEPSRDLLLLLSGLLLLLAKGHGLDRGRPLRKHLENHPSWLVAGQHTTDCSNKIRPPCVTSRPSLAHRIGWQQLTDALNMQDLGGKHASAHAKGSSAGSCTRSSMAGVAAWVLRSVHTDTYMHEAAVQVLLLAWLAVLPPSPTTNKKEPLTSDKTGTGLQQQPWSNRPNHNTRT